MRLSARPANPTDLTACFPLMGDAFAYPAELRAKVPEVWSEWLQAGALTAHVIEHRVPGGRSEPYGLGATVFVERSWIEAMRARGQPYWRAELVRSWQAGERPVLMPDEVSGAQRDGGLTVFFVADALANHALTDEQRLGADAEWGKVLFGLRGCRLESIWIEVYGEKSWRWIGGCGLQTREDWAEYWATTPVARPRPEQRPFLLGITREEALLCPGTHGSFLFMHDAPQFAFTRRHQELLQRALAGDTDEELASALHLSASAVKKRWVAIYERVSAVLPAWLEASDGGMTRGAEKRRHLLNHLRDHPAELHPANAARD